MRMRDRLLSCGHAWSKLAAVLRWRVDGMLPREQESRSLLEFYRVG